jgi:hypothetical protein
MAWNHKLCINLKNIDFQLKDVLFPEICDVTKLIIINNKIWLSNHI